MKKYVFYFLISFCVVGNVFCEKFTFNGIELGSKKGTFQETTQMTIAELNFKNFNYVYENEILTEASAKISGKKNAMVRLADFINVLENKYSMKKNFYMQSGGDIFQLYDTNDNFITIIIANVDNEDCDAEVGEAKIIFTSNLSSSVKKMKDF